MDEMDELFYPQGWFEDLSGAVGSVVSTAQGAVSSAFQQIQGAGAAVGQAAYGAGAEVGRVVAPYVAPVVRVVEQVAAPVVRVAAPVIREVGTVTQQAQEIVSGTISSDQERFQQAITSVGTALVGGLGAVSQIIPPPVSAAPVVPGITISFGPPTSEEMQQRVEDVTAKSAPPVVEPTLLKEPEGILGAAYGIGAQAVAGVLSSVPEFWDVGWNTGVGQFTANVVFNAGVETKNVFNNIVSGKPLTEGLTTGTIVRGIDQGPSNRAGETTKAVLNTIQNTTGVKLEEDAILKMVTPLAMEELKSSSPVIRAVGVGTLMVGGLGNWAIGSPGLAFVPQLSTVMLLQIGEEMAQPGKGPAEMMKGFGTLGTLVLQGPATKVTTAQQKKVVNKYVVQAYTKKDVCVGAVIGTPGCP